MPFNQRTGLWEVPPGWEDMPMPSSEILALFLGASEDSFTGVLLFLMQKADIGNAAKLAHAFPAEARALAVWMDMAEPTMGRLRDALNPPQ